MSETGALWERIRDAEPNDLDVSRWLNEFSQDPGAAELVASDLGPSRRRRTLLALHHPEARELVMQLLPKLTRVAATQVAEVTLVRDVLRRVPTEDLEGPIWPITESILEEQDLEAPRRLAELFSELGLREPLNRLLERIVVSNVRDWYEVAQEFTGIWDTDHWGKPVRE
jgi:hypothetical protein